jgi:hypothetical protein
LSAPVQAVVEEGCNTILELVANRLANAVLQTVER